MKNNTTVLCALALVLLVADVLSSPVSKKQENDDGQINPFEAPSDLFDFDDEIADTGLSSSFFPFSGYGFGGFMKSIEDTINNLRNQMSEVMRRVPAYNVSIAGIPEGKGNTTSTVKVVNGHKITVNETTYYDEDDDSGSVFKIKIIDVQPTSEESDETPKEKPVSKEVEETTRKNVKEEIDSGSPEILEPKLNEIPNDKNEINDSGENIEIFELENNLIPQGSVQELQVSPSLRDLNEIDIIMPVADIETNSVDIDDVPQIPTFDMANDILINEHQSNPEPEAEIFRSGEYFQPIDLSHDVLVNRILSNAEATYNPDAEIITPSENARFPIFQRLRERDPEIIVTK